jgi:tetratricopeptide (TPR) repeat protein
VRARKLLWQVVNIWKKAWARRWISLRQFLSPWVTHGATVLEVLLKFIFAHPIGVATIVTILLLLFEVLTPRSVAILPISVPEYLEDNGYTANVAAIRLRDALRKFAERANTQMKRPEITLRDEMPDFVVPTVGLSFEAGTAYLRTFFRVDRRRNISGEFTIENKVLRLLLRKNGEVFYRSHRVVDLDNPDDLLNDAASEVYKATEPYFYAIEKSHTDPVEAIKLARLMVADLPRSDPNVVWAHNLIGKIFHQEHKIASAIAEYQNAIRLDPGFATGYNNWGLAVQEQGKIGEAIVQFRNAIAADPHYAFAYSNLASALAGLGKADDAKCEFFNAANEFREVVSANLNSAVAHYNLGDALQKYQSAEGDKCEYRGWLGALWHFIFGATRDDKVSSGEAIAEFEEAIRLDPDHAPAYVSLGAALKEKGELDDAIAHFRKAIKSDGHYVDAHLHLASALKSKGESDKVYGFQSAISEYKAAIKRDPGDATAHNKLGNVLQDIGDLRGAIDEYNEAIRLDPEYFTAYANRGLANLFAERYEQASSDLAHVVWERHDQQPYRILLLYLARVGATKRDSDYARQELRTGAIRLGEQAKTVKPEGPGWPFPIIDLFLGRQNVHGTLKVAERLDKEAATRLGQPDTHDKACEAYFYVGKLQLLRGEKAEAKTALKEAKRICRTDFVESVGAEIELGRLER